LEEILASPSKVKVSYHALKQMESEFDWRFYSIPLISFQHLT
jgi:hypothetical protein